MRCLRAVVLGMVLYTTRASASVALSVDKLDSSDGGMQPPSGVVVVDVFADVTNGDRWIAGGVRGVPLGGVTLRYALDPNTGMPILASPGTNNRFVTFGSRPLPRNANSRFANSHVALAGRYCPTGPTATAGATEVNVAYFDSPPETNGGTVDGYVFRVALDIAATGHPAAAFEVFRLGQEPPGAVPYFLSDCDGPSPGTVAATFDVPLITGFDWGVFIVPEPGAAALFLIATPLLARRARGSAS